MGVGPLSYENLRRHPSFTPPCQRTSTHKGGVKDEGGVKDGGYDLIVRSRAIKSSLSGFIEIAPPILLSNSRGKRAVRSFLMMFRTEPPHVFSQNSITKLEELLASYPRKLMRTGSQGQIESHKILPQVVSLKSLLQFCYQILGKNVRYDPS